VARPRRRVPDRPQSSLAPVLGLFTVAYIGIVVLSLMFFDASIPINERIFAPLIVAARASRGIVAHGFERPRQTQLARAMRALPPGQFIATNLPEAVFLDTGRSSIIVPARVNPITGEPNLRFDDQLTELGSRRRGAPWCGRAVLAQPGRALAFPSLEQLERVIGARPIATLDDGVIAAVPPQ
jgi:hypothetical protein